LLLIVIVPFFILISFLANGKTALFGRLRIRLVTVLALSLIGLLGEFGFSYGVRQIIGVDPIRPPFLMARIIADGPGFRFLKKNCAQKPYTVCNYIDRLPTSSDAFLWSTSTADGVYNTVDPATRMALASEQTSFVAAVLLFDPVGVVADAMQDSLRQFLTIGLDEFFLDQQRLQNFDEKLPGSYLAGMLRSRIVSRDWLMAPLKVWYFSTYLLSTLTLFLMLALWPTPRFRKYLEIFPRPQWTYVLTIVAVAVVSNAIICGTLAEPTPRYQTRISWIPLFILALMVAKVCETFSTKANKRRTVEGDRRQARGYV
jgi:hypothetical protein